MLFVKCVVKTILSAGAWVVDIVLLRISMNENNKMEKLEVSVKGKGGWGFVFLPLSVLCCAVLMCASSCNKSDTGNDGENKSGEHNTGSVAGNRTTSSFSSESGSSVSSARNAVSTAPSHVADGSSGDLGAGGFYLWSQLKVSLGHRTEAPNGSGGSRNSRPLHYTMEVSGVEVKPADLGQLVVNSFLSLQDVGGGVMGAVGSRNVTGCRESSELQVLSNLFSEHLARSSYLNLGAEVASSLVFKSTKMPVGQHQRSRAKKVILGGLGAAVSGYISDVLLGFVERGCYRDDSGISMKFRNPEWLTTLENWLDCYCGVKLSDSDRLSINTIYTCLGQDIIDGLGKQMEKLDNKNKKVGDGTSRYQPKVVAVGGSGGLRNFWFTVLEVGLGGTFFRDTGEYKFYSVGDNKKMGSPRGISFGFQTIANIAKDVLCGGLSKGLGRVVI